MSKDREQLAELLKDCAQVHGWEIELWTRNRVAALIGRESDIDYIPRHCSRILHELGYRPVKPKQEAAEKISKQSDSGSKKSVTSLKKLTDGDIILYIDK